MEAVRVQARRGEQRAQQHGRDVRAAREVHGLADRVGEVREAHERDAQVVDRVVHLRESARGQRSSGETLRTSLSRRRVDARARRRVARARAGSFTHGLVRAARALRGARLELLGVEQPVELRVDELEHEALRGRARRLDGGRVSFRTSCKTVLRVGDRIQNLATEWWQVPDLILRENRICTQKGRR